LQPHENKRGDPNERTKADAQTAKEKRMDQHKWESDRLDMWIKSCLEEVLI